MICFDILLSFVQINHIGADVKFISHQARGINWKTTFNCSQVKYQKLTDIGNSVDKEANGNQNICP